LPGGQLGFLIVVNILIFILAFFLDFFELSFIVIPLIGPVAEKLGIDLIWFGVLLGVNMQTSFMHPPFGFALFYLRSVAPAKDYVDRLTGKTMAKVSTGQIYWGAVPFVLIQILMVSLVIVFPKLVTSGLDTKKGDSSKIQIMIPPSESSPDTPPPDLQLPQKDQGGAGPADTSKREDDDLAKSIERALNANDAQKKETGK
jgi:Tripartite ATP-independent periplasmic transporter, DctM component